jgi:hypothetical protein
MAYAYFQRVQFTAQLHDGDAGVLLGFVMAHKLGHLLLGVGHTPDGVMQAAWGDKQMYALRQRWLKFSDNCGERIRPALDARTASVNREPSFRRSTAPQREFRTIDGLSSINGIRSNHEFG